MLNPISDAYNAFLGFLSCIPQPFMALIYLALGIFVILASIRILFH